MRLSVGTTAHKRTSQGEWKVANERSTHSQTASRSVVRASVDRTMKRYDSMLDKLSR